MKEKAKRSNNRADSCSKLEHRGRANLHTHAHLKVHALEKGTTKTQRRAMQVHHHPHTHPSHSGPRATSRKEQTHPHTRTCIAPEKDYQLSYGGEDTKEAHVRPHRNKKKSKEGLWKKYGLVIWKAKNRKRENTKKSAQTLVGSPEGRELSRNLQILSHFQKISRNPTPPNQRRWKRPKIQLQA